MTRISYIHAVPANEIAQRSIMVPNTPRYIPYNSLTKGEMRLMLLAEQARMLSAAYPEMRHLHQAATMLDNAVYNGVHGLGSFIGAIGPELQDVARAITRAKKEWGPAAGEFLTDRSIWGGLRGVRGIYDAPIVPVTTEDCEDYATRLANKQFGLSRSRFWWKTTPFGDKKKRWKELESECETKKAVEGIMNASLQKSSHHVLYKSLDTLKPQLRQTFVRVKSLLHVAGVQGLGNAAEVGKDLMNTWVETALMRENSTLGFGPVDSVITSLSLAPNAQTLAQEYFGVTDKSRGGSTKSDKIGEPITIALIAGVTALVAAIGKSLASASEFQKQLNAKKTGVLNAAQGFGTEAFSAQQSDFDNDAPVTTPTGSNVSTPLILGGAAVLFWALTSK